jgi:hypothetical protein
VSILASQKREVENIVRMLYFCSEPRLDSQIKSYCEIDSVQFNKFAEQCISRGLLRKFVSDDGLFGYVLTKRGTEALIGAQEVMKALGIKQEIPDNTTFENQSKL